MLDPDIFGLRLFGAHEGLSSSNFTSFGDGHKCPSLAKITPKNSLHMDMKRYWSSIGREIKKKPHLLVNPLEKKGSG